jgi:hypothetical protein
MCLLSLPIMVITETGAEQSWAGLWQMVPRLRKHGTKTCFN